MKRISKSFRLPCHTIEYIKRIQEIYKEWHLTETDVVISAIYDFWISAEQRNKDLNL